MFEKKLEKIVWKFLEKMEKIVWQKMFICSIFVKIPFYQIQNTTQSTNLAQCENRKNIKGLKDTQIQNPRISGISEILNTKLTKIIQLDFLAKLRRHKEVLRKIPRISASRCVYHG